jgi:hypothetical protein
MRGLEGVRKAKVEDDVVTLEVTEKAVVLPSEIRKALDKKYAMGKVRVELTGTVDKKDGKHVLKARGSEKVFALEEGEVKGVPPEHPFKRLRRLFDDGMSTFVVGGVLREDKDETTGKVMLALEVTSAALPDEKKK